MFRLPTAGEWTRRPLAWVLKVTGGALPLSCTSSTASFPVWPVWGLFSFLKLLPLPDTIQDMEDREWDPRGKKGQGPGDKITGQGNSLEVTEKAQRCWSPRGPGNPVLRLGTGSGGLALPLESRSWSAQHCKPWRAAVSDPRPPWGSRQGASGHLCIMGRTCPWATPEPQSLGCMSPDHKPSPWSRTCLLYSSFQKQEAEPSKRRRELSSQAVFFLLLGPHRDPDSSLPTSGDPAQR